MPTDSVSGTPSASAMDSTAAPESLTSMPTTPLIRVPIRPAFSAGECSNAAGRIPALAASGRSSA
jgi:hypothetical protein